MKRLLIAVLWLASITAIAQSNDFKWIKQQTYTATGTDTYAATVSGVTAYTIGLEVKILFTNANTGPATLNINSLGVKTLRKNGSSALAAADLAAGATYRLTYDGTYFQVLGLGGAGGGGSLFSVKTPSIVANAYTVQSTDNYSLIEIDNGATDVTVTFPNGLVDDFNCTIINKGTGIVTLVATGTMESIDGSSPTIENTDIGASVYHKGSNIWTATGALGTYTAAGDVFKVGTPSNNQVGVWTGDGTIEGASSLTYNGSNLQLTGDIGSTGSRITKGWFTDLQVTNAIAGSITGNAATVTTNANLSGDVTSSGNTTTISAGAVDIAMLSASGTPSGSTYLRGDNTWATVAGGFTDPMTTRGDIIYRNSSNATARLAAGANTYVLTSDGTDIAWAAPTGGFSNPMTTEGDLILATTGGTAARLPIGSNTYVLTSNGTTASWAAPSGGSGLTVGTSTITSGTNTRVLYNNSGVLGEYTVSGSGNVAMTTSPVFTTPNIGVATGTASGNWFGTGTTTFTGAVDIVGSSSNTWKGTFNSLGAAQTDGAGLHLRNTTAAAAGAQQWSPSLVLEGQGWKTNATAASQSVKWAIDVTPVQGSSAPTSTLSFKSSINGAAYSSLMTLTSGNVLSVVNLRSSTLQAQSGDNLTLQSGSSAARIDAALQTPTGIASFLFSSGAEVNKASGDVGSINLTHGFAPASGTATYYGLGIQNTVNMTGGANGAVSMVHIRPTYTAAGGDVYGINYNPTVTSVSGTHLAYRATSGSVLLGGSSLTNANTILDVQSTTKGIGFPRMTTTERDAISSAYSGLYIHNTSTGNLNYYDGTSWVEPQINNKQFTSTSNNVTQNIHDFGVFPNSSMITIDVDINFIQTSGTVGSSSIFYRISRTFRRTSGGTVAAVAATTTLISVNDTGDTFGTAPTINVGGSSLDLVYDISSSSKTFNVKASINKITSN